MECIWERFGKLPVMHVSLKTIKLNLAVYSEYLRFQRIYENYLVLRGNVPVDVPRQI